MKYYYFVTETTVTERSLPKNIIGKFRFIHVIQTDGDFFPIVQATAKVFELSVRFHLPHQFSKGLFTTAVLNQFEISEKELETMVATNQYEGHGILTDLVVVK